ncbi:uncharacterized protein LOC143441200 [Arvicanthis niloticus]|uniref:uncharacterized protein LOC143311420 n=1 Tax=Arvicanthis niloticus TaxID=61156 RepID=UPI00402B1481
MPQRNPTSDWGRRGQGRVEGGNPLPPKPAMWQLKEPSKPKCVCAHTQFITAEHMANILTHVSRARKTNRALRGGAAPPLRLRRPRGRERASERGWSPSPKLGGGRSRGSSTTRAPQLQAGVPKTRNSKLAEAGPRRRTSGHTACSPGADRRWGRSLLPPGRDHILGRDLAMPREPSL